MKLEEILAWNYLQTNTGKKKDSNNHLECFLVFTYMITCFWLLVSGLSVKFTADNPVVVETNKNITLKWSINKTTGSNVRDINAYVQSQSIKKRKIVTWGNNEPIVLRDAEKIYDNRLKTDFAGNKFSLKIINAKYVDSGNYSAEVLLESFEKAVQVATVNVYGMFFSYFQ